MNCRDMIGMFTALALTVFAGSSANALDNKAKAGKACECCVGTTCCASSATATTKAIRPKTAEKKTATAKVVKAKACCACCPSACTCSECSTNAKAKAGKTCECVGKWSCCSTNAKKAVAASVGL